MAQWTLTDNSTGTPVVLTFDINPTKFEHPGRQSNLSFEQTTSPAGGYIAFQGKDRPQSLSFSGAVITESFYDDLNTWKDKWYPMTLTDDEGNTWDIIIQEWKWTRVKRRNPWRFDYSCKATVIT